MFNPIPELEIVIRDRKLAPCVAFSLLAFVNPASAASVTAMWTNVDSSGNPLVPGSVYATDVVASLTPAAIAAHNSAALTGRVFWINQSSTRTTLSDGRTKVTDLSGNGNHAYATAGGPTWDTATGGGGFYFNGVSGYVGVPGVTLAKLPIGSAFSYLVTVCPTSSSDPDPSTTSSYNAVLSLGTYNGLSDRGWVNLLQKSSTPANFVDASAGVEGNYATKTIKPSGGACSVIAGRVFWNGTAGYGKTLLNLDGSVSYGTPNQVTVNGTRIAGSYLTIGGEVNNPGRTLFGVTVPEVQIFNVALTNQQLTLEANAALMRAGQTPSVRLVTLLDPASTDGGYVPADFVSKCISGGRCISTTMNAMTTDCGGLPTTLSATCAGGTAATFDPDTDRCVTFPILNEWSGLPLNIQAQNRNAALKSGLSNTVNCTQLAPAVK